jgi:hypothetical protein
LSSVAIPAHVSFSAGDAFPANCVVNRRRRSHGCRCRIH